MAMPNPVLILGAGINGAALARELALNGVGVVLVDRQDLASGATSYSSRLIHGGLRYLEYGDFALVREALGERTRLLRLAPQFVRPLRLFIPIQNRFGGLMSAAKRFLGLKDRPHPGRVLHRGLWTVRFGLWLYDRYARDPTLPRHESHRTTDADIVQVDRSAYRWVCSFSDAQVVFPERFTLALLEDGRQIAAARGTEFRVLTYHEAELTGDSVTIRPLKENALAGSAVAEQLKPSLIVNATGAWVDHTLRALGVPSKQLMGGTKGSHFVTSNARLQQRLGGRAIYTEAGDGRPIFILPFDLPFMNGTLVGTTDMPFPGDPASAVATPPELEYLVAAVNEVFPDIQLKSAEIDLTYAGVRPLPFSDASTPGAVSRRHWMEPNPNCALPLYSIIGGKLTTCRSLAEEAAGEILQRLGLPRTANSEERPIIEREPYFAVRGTGSSLPTNAPSQKQPGTNGLNDSSLLIDTQIPIQVVQKMIAEEWVTKLDDLVERRLMLVYHPQLSRKCLEQLADLLIGAGKLAPADKNSTVDAVIRRLSVHFGKRVIS
jgi:glycerol-3-phosphate dehydrogenase